MRRWAVPSAILVVTAGVAWLTLPLWRPLPTLDEVLREAAKKELVRAKVEDAEAEAASQERLVRFKKSCVGELESKEICRVHQENLKPDAVKIVYGLILPIPEREEAEAKFFPNSNKLAYGGCILGQQEFECVLYCQGCRQAESEWEDQHRQSESKTEVAINEGDFQPVSTSEASSNLIKKVDPYYPRVAERARVSGVVNLQLFISKTGKVVGVKVRSGHPLLYEAAISAARQWTYKPFMRDHQPVNVTADAAVLFSLNRS